MADIAVIIVNYGTADLTIAAVESVRARRHAPHRITIHVVDNASPGEDAARLQAQHVEQGWGAEVQLYLEDKNHGFGRGNNVALQVLAETESPPDYVFLLNPDARLENDALVRLASALEADPDVVAAGSGILDEQGVETPAAFRFPTPLRALARQINFGPLDRRCPELRIALPADTPAGPVNWVSGAAVMFRFPALQKVEFFDPAYFLYYEEVDLMRRLTEAGGQILYTPEARVLHLEGAATGQVGKATKKRRPTYLYQSWRRYFVAAFGRGLTLLTALAILPAAAFNWLHSRLRGKTPNLPAHFFRDHCRLVIVPLLWGEPRR